MEVAGEVRTGDVLVEFDVLGCAEGLLAWCECQLVRSDPFLAPDVRKGDVCNLGLGVEAEPESLLRLGHAGAPGGGAVIQRAFAV